MRHTPSVSSRRATAASPSSCSVSTSRSASSGGSYGASTPVKPGQLAGAGPRVQALRVAALAFLRPACRRRPRRSRARRASCSSRASFAVGRASATRARRPRPTPASASRRATWATRRMCSPRSPGCEAEVVGQPVADVVAVEQVRGPAGLDELALERDRDRRLAGGRQPGQPHGRAAGPSAPQRCSRSSSDSCQVTSRRRGRRPASALARLLDHARADGVVGVLVDEDERAGDAVVGVAVGEHGRARAQRDAADVVELEPARRGLALERRRCRAAPCDGLDRRAHRARRVLERVAGARAAAASSRHPATVASSSRAATGAPSGAEIRSPRPTSRSSARRTETDSGDTAASSGPSSVSTSRRPWCASPTGITTTSSPGRQRAAGELARVHALVVAAAARADRSTAPGSRSASRVAVGADLDRLEVLEQRRPVVPGRGSERSTTLSPCSARSGSTRRVRRPRGARPARGTRSRCRGSAASSQSTRSILFTHATRCWMPSSADRSARGGATGRRSPLRASIEHRARARRSTRP